MRQSVLPFQCEVEQKEGGLTALAGLPLYLEFAHLMGLRRLMAEKVRAADGEQGWTDDQMIMALVLLNLAGGDCVENLSVLEGDEGFCRFLREVEDSERTRSEKKALRKWWRKERTRTFPSPTALREYLERYHDSGQELKRTTHRVFILRPSDLLGSLMMLNGAFAGAFQGRSPQSIATLDMDATLVETFKKTALYCYKKHKAYQPLNFYLG